MRRFKIFGLALGIAAALGGATYAQRGDQADASAAARRIPGGGELVLYLEFQGLAAHRDAWEATALHDLMTNTKLGTLIETVVGQFAAAVRADAGADAANAPTDAEIKLLAGRLADDGFALAIVGGPTNSSTIMAFRGMARDDVKPVVEKLLTPPEGRESESVEVGGRTLRKVGSPSGVPTFSWNEGEDLIVATPSASVEIEPIVNAIASGEGTAADDPTRQELAKAEGGFQPILLGFFDTAKVMDSRGENQEEESLHALGFDGLNRVDFRWGFDGKALVTIARMKAPAPRRGMLALLDGPTIKKADLPAVPASATGFTAMALDPDAIYEKVRAIASESPDGVGGFEELENGFRQQFGVDLRRDLLARIGPEMVIYQAATGGVAPNPGGMMMNPFGGLTLAAEARETKALADSLAKLVRAIGPMIAQAGAQNGQPGPMLSASPDGRTFTLVLPPRMFPVPLPIRPTLTVGDNRIALALDDASAKAAVGRESGGWAPKGEFAETFEHVPAEMVLLNVSDPRETLPGLIASLPQFSFAINAAINQARAASAQAAGRPAPSGPILNVTPAMVPTAEEVRSRLFPATTALTADDDGLTLTTRESFPGLTSPAGGGVAIALLLPAVQAAREAARRAQCSNNLKQIALAMYNYESANGTFPPAAITGPDGKPLLSWRVAILPYLEQQAVYDQFHLDEPWDSPHNKALAEKVTPPVFLCPSNAVGMVGHAHYRVLTGPGTAFEGTKGHRIAEFTDGTSNTLMVVESNDTAPWTKPEGIDAADPAGMLDEIGSGHPGGFNAAFADGSVRFLKQTIAPAVLKALSTRNGGEILNSDDY